MDGDKLERTFSYLGTNWPLNRVNAFDSGPASRPRTWETEAGGWSGQGQLGLLWESDSQK